MLTHFVEPATAMQAGTKGNFTHSSGIPSRFASLHDVPCMLPPTAGFARVSAKLPRAGDTKASEQQAQSQLKESSHRELSNLPDTAAESMPTLSQNTSILPMES